MRKVRLVESMEVIASTIFKGYNFINCMKKIVYNCTTYPFSILKGSC